LIDWLSFNDSLRTWSMDPKGNTFWDMRLGAINVLEDLAIMSNGDVVMPWINMEAITGTDGAARQTVDIVRIDDSGNVVFREHLEFTDPTMPFKFSGGTIIADSSDRLCVVHLGNSSGIYTVCMM